MATKPATTFCRESPACCVVPYEGLSADVASLCEPAGVAYDMVKTAGIHLGDRVAVIGPGPIALMAIPMLLRGGAVSVTCIGRPSSKRRLEVAHELGAEAVAIESALDERADLKRQFDHVLVTAPVDAIPPALSLLAYGGTLTYIGIGTGNPRITFDANDFHFRKLQLRASFASPAVYFPVVLDLLKREIIPGRKLISHRFPLERIAAAMETVRDNRASVVKVVVVT